MRLRTLSRSALVVLALTAVFTPAARAQNKVAVGGLEYRSISFQPGVSYTKVSEFVVPLGLIWTINPRMTVDFGTRIATASSTTAPDTTGNSVNASISGLTDTQARLVYQVRPDVLALSFTANLPTGKSLLTAPQLGVAGPIAHDLIPYPVSNFGSGTSVTTGFALAVPYSGWAVGIGGAYRMSGSYTAFVDPATQKNFNLKPGAEFRFSLGGDRVFGDSHLSLGLTYSSFATDEFGGQQLVPGKRVIVQGSYSRPLFGANLALYAWNLYRGSSADTAGAPATAKQDLVTFGAAMTIPQGRRQLRPTFEYRRHWAGFDSLQPEGTLMSLGLRYAVPAGDRMTLLPALRYDFGTVAGFTNPNVGFTGLSASLMLRTSW